MKAFVLAAFVVLSTSLQAASLSAPAAGEIDHLLHYLADSGCEFKRNGSWHTSAEASAHLQRKYEYLIDKGMLSDAESFIARAATESSMTSQAYEVRCAGQPTVQSATWLKAELQRMRSGKN